MSIRRPLIAAVLAAGLALSACSSSESSDGESLEKVDYLTSFNTFGRDAYVYVAQEKGYFEDAGIEVSVKPGTGSVDVMKLIASGRADFGPADFSTVAITVANEDLPVKAVAMIQQQTLAAIVSLEGNGITQPSDLEGKKIADQAGSTNQVLFPAYAAAAGFDADKVTFVPSAPPSLPQLLGSGKVDAIGQFVVGKGLIESASNGKKAVFLPYGDVLPNLYGNALMTSEKLAKDNPELVEKFTAALLKGLEYSIANPEETGKILAKYQPTQKAEVAAGEVTLMAPYVKGTEGAELGTIDEARVTEIVDQLTQAKAIKEPVEASDLVDTSVVEGAQR